MELSESHKYTASLSDVMTTLAKSGNPSLRLQSFLEVEISKMIWPSPKNTIIFTHNFHKMALVPPRYRAYIPSLPNYDPDPPVQQRSPAFLPFRVGGIPVDDHSCLSEEASAGSQGFERFITPLLEFDWNEPWNTIPNVLRWIAPFLKSTQQSVLSLFCFLYLVILTRSIRENPPDMSEIGLLAEMYLKGIILLIESLYMGRLFFENYATNAAWYFDRRRVREKYTLVIGENEGGPWKIAMALSKGASDSFALAQGHADAVCVSKSHD
ncbi:hypothetical protein M422DRAFT_29444 [Sphaerobolus stellatus SS14]|uniref:Uncharacterized protein n=1 Tax=Sphaerobolus stellatus (strain SS14) TaxID=990650 RepID=A0A0C9W439_SPHS4|nr:hypothetical protein M422DRAFT_29444 [Sphaerobolus stellatus SS14]